MTEIHFSTDNLTGPRLQEHMKDFHTGFRDPNLSEGAENLGDYLRMIYHEAEHRGNRSAGWPSHDHRLPTPSRRLLRQRKSATKTINS